MKPWKRWFQLWSWFLVICVISSTNGGLEVDTRTWTSRYHLQKWYRRKGSTSSGADSLSSSLLAPQVGIEIRTWNSSYYLWIWNRGKGRYTSSGWSWFLVICIVSSSNGGRGWNVEIKVPSPEMEPLKSRYQPLAEFLIFASSVPWSWYLFI